MATHRKIFAFQILAILLALVLIIVIGKAHGALGASLSPLSKVQANDLVLKCAKLYDTGRTIGNDLNLCDRIMDHVDNYCRDHYNELCFGNAWANYDFHHKNKNCIYFEDNSKKCESSKKITSNRND